MILKTDSMGRILIPIRIREELGLEPNQKIRIEVLYEEKEIKIKIIEDKKESEE